LNIKTKFGILAVGIMTVFITVIGIAGVSILLLHRAFIVSKGLGTFDACCLAGMPFGSVVPVVSSRGTGAGGGVVLAISAAQKEHGLLAGENGTVQFTIVLAAISMLLSGIIILSVLMFITRPMLKYFRDMEIWPAK